jgi:hypothetical protein
MTRPRLVREDTLLFLVVVCYGHGKTSLSNAGYHEAYNKISRSHFFIHKASTGLVFGTSGASLTNTRAGPLVLLERHIPETISY